MDQCPIPTLLEHGNFSQVLFNNVEKFYVPRGDIMCFYTLTEKFIPRPKDWIGIFKVEWKTTQEYYTFMWAPLPKDQNKDSATQQEIQFKAYYLPKDVERYQFCYVDEDGLVRGTSVPFQFCPDPDEDIMVVINKEKVEEMEQRSEELYQENQELKDKYADLHEQLQRKQVALEATQRVNKTLEQEVEEKASCKEEKASWEEKTSWEEEKASWEEEKASWEKEKASWEQEKTSWESELRQVKEYNQKMMSEKMAFWTRIEELQNEPQKILEQTVEMWKKKEAVALRKQPKLKAILHGYDVYKVPQSFLDDKDFSSPQESAEPEVSSSQVAAEPKVPWPQGAAKPESLPHRAVSPNLVFYKHKSCDKGGPLHVRIPPAWEQQ